MSAISVAHTGMPRTNPEVPSIGSTTQRHGDAVSPCTPCSSPNRPWPGRRREQALGEQVLGALVGLGHLRAVVLPAEREVGLLVAGEREGVGQIGQLERERELVGEVGFHGDAGYAG